MNLPRTFQTAVLAILIISILLLALGGYYFGEHWEELRAIMRPFDIPIAIVLVVGFAYYVYRHVSKGRKGTASAASEMEK